jgi:hypothetical protein
MAGPERPDQPDGPPPFGEDDDSVLDARLVHRELEITRKALQAVQARLTQMRYKPGPDQQVPEVREITRIDGQWPFLLIRTYPGDVGKRPVQSGDEPPGYAFSWNSPDIIVTEPGPRGEARIIDRDGIAALKERETDRAPRLNSGWTYDVWVHVWNLGQSQVSGVRVRVRVRQSPFIPPEPVVQPEVFLGGTTLDLGDRLSDRAHRVVKAVSFTVPAIGLTSYGALLVATVDTLSDPSSGDLSQGADRHTAHHWVVADPPAGPQFG